MNTKIIIDSSTNINPKIKDDIIIVPLTVRFGNNEYIDGITLSNKEFYEKLIESDVIPTTSQATPANYAEIFEKIQKNGDSAVVITISAKLSGTYQSAAIAAKDYDNIFVVDSNSASIGAGILTELAVNLAKQNMDAKEIAEKITSERNNIYIVAMLDTLEYMKRGGRISKIAAFAGSILNIKPVICLENGEISVLGKARGSKQGNNLLITEIEKSGGIDFSKPVLLGYTGLDDYLLKKYISDSESLWKGNIENLSISEVGSIIGTHAGPGAIAAAFYKKQK